MLEATLIALDKASNAIMSWVGLVWQTASVEVRFCQEEYLLKSLSEPSCLQRISVHISSGHSNPMEKRCFFQLSKKNKNHALGS